MSGQHFIKTFKARAYADAEGDDEKKKKAHSQEKESDNVINVE